MPLSLSALFSMIENNTNLNSEMKSHAGEVGVDKLNEYYNKLKHFMMSDIFFQT